MTWPIAVAAFVLAVTVTGLIWVSVVLLVLDSRQKRRRA